MGQAAGTKRVTATVDAKTFERLKFWSEHKNISINQFLNDAIILAINFENKNYPLPTLEQARLNQIVDAVNALSSNQRSLEKTVISVADMFIRMTRGDNYLMEDNMENDS